MFFGYKNRHIEGVLLIALFAIGPAFYNKEVRSLSRIVEENSYVGTNDNLKID